MKKLTNTKKNQQKKNRKAMVVPYGVRTVVLNQMKEMGCNSTFHTVDRALAGYCYTYEQCLVRKLALETNKYIFIDDIQ